MEKKFWVVVIALSFLGPLSPLSRIAFTIEGSDLPVVRIIGALGGALLRNWLIVLVIVRIMGWKSSPPQTDVDDKHLAVKKDDTKTE